MARSTQRASGSQRPSRESTQRPANRRKASRRSARGDPPVEEEDEEQDDDEAEGVDGEGAMDDDEEAVDAITRKATALVRLALFNEHKRIPLKRDDINKKVGTTQKTFNEVLSQAQEILRKTFAFDLVELPSAEAIQAELNEQDGQGSGAKSKGGGQRSYILRNRLPSDLVRAAVEVDSPFLQDEVADYENNKDDELTNDFNDADEEALYARADGAVIAWSKADDLTSIGILYVVLALILANNREASDVKVVSYLRRLQINDTTEIKVSIGKSVTLETLLDSFVTKRYLLKEKQGDLGKQGAKRQRGGERGDERVPIVWKWGPRAHTEIGETRMAKFLVDFMVTATASHDDEEDEERLVAEQEQAKEKLMETLVKTVGGRLFN